MIFYLDKRRQAYDKAARMRAHDWWGLRPGWREAYIWGSPVELSKQDRLKRFRDWLTNEMLLSAFEISEGSIGRLVERIRRFRPKCLFGYPSSIALTCQLARRAGLDLRDLGVKVVFCTAEVLYDRQKQIITESTGAEVANGYGSREGGFISHECPHGGMHMTAENIIVELIKDGRPAAAGEDGEIVVTHLDNHAMPFIRYRTGDVAQSSDAQCPCGRPLPLMREIKGRSTDFILTPDGRWMHGLGLVYVMRDIVGVQEYQIVQSDVDAITVRLVTDDHFPASGESRIRQGIATAMGGEVDVSIDFVTEIQRSASGKFRYVISEVARDREKSL